jgi:hypothetical protein
VSIGQQVLNSKRDFPNPLKRSTVLAIRQQARNLTATLRRSCSPETSMSSLPADCERRASQRFEFTFPVSIHVPGEEKDRCGFTQNITGKGMFLFSDCALAEGTRVELTFSMPAEITLTDGMRVRCTGKVLRVSRSVEGAKYGIAVCFESYAYLQDGSAQNAAFERISWLHRQDEAPEQLRRVTTR